MAECSVYIVGAEDTPIKIGMAGSPTKRAVEIRCSAPWPVRLLETWEFASRPFAYAVEQAAHAALHEYRLNGEWFDITFGEAARLVDNASDMVAELAAGYHSVVPEFEADLWVYVKTRLSQGSLRR